MNESRQYAPGPAGLQTRLTVRRSASERESTLTPLGLMVTDQSREGVIPPIAVCRCRGARLVPTAGAHRPGRDPCRRGQLPDWLRGRVRPVGRGVMSDVMLICLVVIPCTYALALVALVRAEYRQPRQVIKGGHIVVATDARTIVVRSDGPRVAATSQGVMPAEFAAPGRVPVGGSPMWRAVPAAQLPRGRQR
jgi:hypothetical protein